MGSLAAWIHASRPKTLPASAGGVFVGTALAAAEGHFHADRLAAALLVAGGLQVATNLYNDYGDYLRGADRDRIGPPRAVQSGWLSPAAVRAGAIAALVVTAVAGLYLVRVGGWPALLLGAASMASAVLYTAGPAPLAYVGLGDVFVMLFFGGTAVCGSHLVQAGTVSLRSLIAAFAVGALATAILVVNNLRDREGDGRVGKRTLVVRFGERFGRLEYAALMVAAYLTVAAVGVVDHGWLLPLASAPLAVAAVARVRRLDGPDLNPELGRTAALGLAFNVLLAIGALL